MIGTAKRLFPLKWKLSLALVSLSLALVTVYIVIAKRTFEDDKIAYVYESQQRKLAPLAKSLNLEVEQFLFNAAAIAASFDPASHQLGAAGIKIFNQAEHLRAIELVDGAGQSVFHLEKQPGTLEGALGRLPPNGKKFDIRYDRDGDFLLSMAAPEGDSLGFRVLGRIEGVVSEAPETVLLHQKGNVILPENVPSPVREFLTTRSTIDDGLTATQQIGGITYLVSTRAVGTTGLFVTSLIPESAALAALRLMFERSIYFLLLSAFVTLILSTLLAGRLVRSLVVLTDAVERVKGGDLTTKTALQSNDEVGVLGEAFDRMVAQIRVLLEDTREKSRMEAELNTARAVQDSLLPDRPWSSLTFELAGYCESASECGGDFWFYWECDGSLYFMIGDVTGHGAPAALLTSAVRSTLSAITTTGEKDLAKIAALIHQTVYDCTKGRRLMTAFFARLHLDSNRLDFINCSHEPALLAGPGRPPEFIGLNTFVRLGDLKPGQTFAIESREIQPGETFLLYTDGASEISDPQDRRIRELYFVRNAADCLVQNYHAAGALDQIVRFLKDYSKKPLEDDLTMVCLKARFAAGFMKDGVISPPPPAARAINT